MKYIDWLAFCGIRFAILQMKACSKIIKPNGREECFDRIFINDYVKRNEKYIRGDVLEFSGGDVIYAKKYGNAKNVYLMAGEMHEKLYPKSDFFSNLDDERTLPAKRFDCIIATQVIMYMNNPYTALQNLKKMLKLGGMLILTVPGPLFHHSKNTHHMFSFTEESIKYMCQRVFGSFDDFEWYGNIECVQHMLFWIKHNGVRDLSNKDYRYTLVMGITCRNNR